VPLKQQSEVLFVRDCFWKTTSVSFTSADLSYSFAAQLI